MLSFTLAYSMDDICPTGGLGDRGWGAGLGLSPGVGSFHRLMLHKTNKSNIAGLGRSGSTSAGKAIALFVLVFYIRPEAT